MNNPTKRRILVPWKTSIYCLLVLVFIFGFTFSTLRLFFKGTFRPHQFYSWRTPATERISGDFPDISVRETVMFPDQALIFLKYPPSTTSFTKNDIGCVYLPGNSSEPLVKLTPVATGGEYHGQQILRCPLRRGGDTITVHVKSSNAPAQLPPGPSYRWDSLVYEGIIDRDGTTIVFVKGLNLRGGKIADPSRFECVYGWDFTKPKFLLRSEVLSVAQEIVRCKTPLSILSISQRMNTSVKVSVRAVGKRIMDSVARPSHRIKPVPPTGKEHQICVCTMLRNQARFIREWVMYHARIGVQRWFIYDNNSNDEINNLVESLDRENYNITRHLWPWIKTQEAGFVHCALRARDSCEWIGFIDVDEFLHLPSGLSLSDVIKNQSGEVAELRVWCHSFGPSGLKRIPRKGVTVGYTCRVAAPERHKSIVKPEALNSTLLNLVHHFHLRADLKYVNIDRNLLVINHYKYQVWEVFKEKFHRRVSTYVSDWQEEENVGSKDRVPCLGTRAVEPSDWSIRFCEVIDTGLRDQVLDVFNDPRTQMLPWEEQQK